MQALLRVTGPDLECDVPLDPTGAVVTLGRDATADVQLADPAGFISRKHVALRCAGGSVEMHILSAFNGVETSRGPVRPGERVRLDDGDYFVLGLYTITVCAASPDAMLGGVAASVRAPTQHEVGIGEFPEDSIPPVEWATASIDRWLNSDDGADLYRSGVGDAQPQDLIGAAGVTHVNVERGDVLPSSRATGERVVLWAAFAKGLGLPPSHPVDEQTAEHAGKLIQLLVEGLSDLLSVRGQIRKELGVVDRTMMTGHDTNQFKTGLHIGELIQHLFSAHVGAAYMRPERAVRECIAELQIHEQATLMAVRATLEGALNEFEPMRMQHDLLSGKLSPFQLLNNARSWKAYEAHFKERSLNLADWLEKMFDRHFTATYTLESNRLKILHSRRSDP